MAAIRSVLETSYIPLDPGRAFATDLPRSFLDDEPRRERLEEIWNKDVRTAINEVFRTRKAVMMNRHIKEAVFQSKLENVCAEFSRRTENVKVVCVKSVRMNGVTGRQTDKFHLKVTKLSPISAAQRNARHCLAEIPTLVQEVQAVIVGTTDTSGTMEPGISTPLVPDSAVSSCLPCAPTEALVAAAASVQYEEDTYFNPPIAADVTAIVEDDIIDEDLLSSGRCDSQRSALERMQELESIRMFLSDDEYSSKRQEILNSI